MINLDLNEIVNKTSTRLRYPRYYNWYSWKEVLDVTANKEFYNVPLIDVPLSKLQDEGKLRELFHSEFLSYVCFGRFTVEYRRRVKSTNVSRILFDVAPSTTQKTEYINNYCWMNEEQLGFWISTIREEAKLDFYFRIEKRDDERYHILFDFKRLNKTKIKYVLFWTRYAFEYPAYFCALDAMLLKRDYYPEETMQNLLTLTGICQRNNGGYRITVDQCITVNGNFITREALRKKLNTSRSVQNIFGHPNCSVMYPFAWQPERIYGTKIVPIVNNQGFNGEDWIGNTKRFDNYTKIYDVLKEHEIKLDEKKS